MWPKRLLWQVFLPFVAIILAVLLGASGYASSRLRQFYITQATDDLHKRALLAAELLAPTIGATDHDALDEAIKHISHEVDTRITVILADGRVTADAEEDPAAMDNHGDRPEVQRALTGDTGTAIRYSYTLEVDMLYVAVPITRDGTTVAVVRTAVAMTELAAALRLAQFQIAGVGFGCAALAALVSLLVSRRLSRPLESLRLGAEHFAAGTLDHRLAVNGSEEILALSSAMNDMAQQLNERLGQLANERNERNAILASMVEGVLAVDTSQRVISLNTAAASLLAIDADTAMGRPLQEIVRNPDLHALVEEALAGDSPIQTELSLHDSLDRLFDVHATPIRNASGVRIGTVLMLHDVTQLRHLETIRREFVANVSHELRTPITAIQGFVETLVDGAVDDAQTARRFLNIVAKQAHRLNAIVEDLLALSRLEQGDDNPGLALTEGSILDVLSRAVEVCQHRADEKGIAIDVSCPNDLSAPINGPLLEQAIINLLDNAIKYSADRQTVHVEAERTDMDIVIRVQDHGFGIEAKHLPRLFERFYRVDKARSRTLGGTGLGLAIVKHIAQVHRGRPSVESCPGQGSTFAIHLPTTSLGSLTKN